MGLPMSMFESKEAFDVAQDKLLTHEAKRYCHGEDAWTDWKLCTAEQAARYKKDDTFRVRLRVLTPNEKITDR